MSAKENTDLPTLRTFELWGANGSPYSVKMRSYMRFKRLPFLWKSMNEMKRGRKRPGSGGPGAWPERFKHIRPKVIPVLVYPDGQSQNDSSFLIKTIERKKYAPNRPALPIDPVLSFIALLFEDFADEWLTKVMYGMRWNRKRDIEWSALLLASDAMGGIASHDNVKKIAGSIGKIQSGRTRIVGCPDSTIHRTFHEICQILEELFKKQRFLLGAVPTIADFAFYGQMSQWIIDRTSGEMLPLQYPAVFAWLWRMDDTSGVEISANPKECWIDLHGIGLNQSLAELLKLIGVTYLPFLKANSEAIKAGRKKMSTSIFEGSEGALMHEQKSFKYQHKCYVWLQQEVGKLSNSDKNRLKDVLKGSNCWEYLVPNKSKL